MVYKYEILRYIFYFIITYFICHVLNADGDIQYLWILKGISFKLLEVQAFILFNLFLYHVVDAAIFVVYCSHIICVTFLYWLI